MILGGDQVYSDDVFAASEELRQWNFAKKGMAKEKAVCICIYYIGVCNCGVLNFTGNLTESFLFKKFSVEFPVKLKTPQLHTSI